MDRVTDPDHTGDERADEVAALRSARGQRLLDRIARDGGTTGGSATGSGAARGEAAEEDGGLRLATELRRDYPPDLVSAALTQHRLRREAAGKFSRADQMLFTRAGLEQASGELVARHRTTRYAGAGRLADLCCGIGGDLVALAGGYHVLAVDRDPRHVAMAAHNAEVYQVAERVTTRTADVRDVDLSGMDGVFVDPARRRGDRRMSTGDSEPPLGWCLALAQQVPAVGIKAAPGLALDIVPPGWEVEFVADRRDLKEATLWSPALATASRRATVLPAGDTLLAVPGPPVPVAPPGGFLLDPNPAVTRAGLVEDLARTVGAWKIDPQIAFLSTDTDRRTPFARTLRVAESAPWHERRFARRLRELDIGAVDIRRRGLAGDVARIRRGLKLQGSRPATVVITRVDDRPWGMVCLPPDDGITAAAS